MAHHRRLSLRGEPGHRYGALLLLTMTLLVFIIAAPDEHWSRLVALALAGGLLGLSLRTSGIRGARRHGIGIAFTVTGIALAVAIIGPGTAPVADRVGTAILIGVPPTIIAWGLTDLIAKDGVTIRAVMGALTIYLLIGACFAYVYGTIGAASGTPFFGGSGNGDASEYVYFSFTALTTTGFGDLAAATDVGRAVVVLEMIFGQLYLVTVVAVLVGNFRPRQRR